MIPVIAIIGRPNVGKSTLFNRLTRTRKALVADVSGVTRDRQYGKGHFNEHQFMFIDTGGLGIHDDNSDTITELISEQTFQAIKEADVVLWLLDGLDGLLAEDQELAIKLRKINKHIYLVINKTEGKDSDLITADFHTLGMGHPFAISAKHGDGINDLLEDISAHFSPQEIYDPVPPDALQVAVLGKPNVGKSTLINRILGENRLIATDLPGTTRDSITVHYQRNNRDYLLIDTAGVRRRTRVNEMVEKFSIVKTLKTIDQAEIIILLLDAQAGISDQDARLLGMVTESGKGLILAINKWDGLSRTDKTRIKNQLDRKLGFIDYACIHYISALHGSGVGKLFESLEKIDKSLRLRPSTSKLTGYLQQITAAHSPGIVKGRRIKLRYAHLGGHNPFRIILHGNQTENVSNDYIRYLANAFRKKLKLTGVPVKIEFKKNINPYKGRKSNKK